MFHGAGRPSPCWSQGRPARTRILKPGFRGSKILNDFSWYYRSPNFLLNAFNGTKSPGIKNSKPHPVLSCPGPETVTLSDKFSVGVTPFQGSDVLPFFTPAFYPFFRIGILTPLCGARREAETKLKYSVPLNFQVFQH